MEQTLFFDIAISITKTSRTAVFFYANTRTPFFEVLTEQ